MARTARLILPNMPHFVTQRGFNDGKAFFKPEDYRLYLRLAEDAFYKCKVKVKAWCLLENKVVFVLEPKEPNSLARALGETHRRYSRIVNNRENKTGRLWHARFNSFAFEKSLLPEGIRIVEQMASEVKPEVDPLAYPWSSAAARISGAEDPLRAPAKVRGIPDWGEYLGEVPEDDLLKKFGAHERTGRPMGSLEFILGLEEKLGKRLRPRKRGRKPGKKISKPE